MRGFIVTDNNEGQVVNLPAGEYTYSFRVIPVGSSYTFKIDNLEFTIEDLTPGVMTPRLKCIFELNATGSKFYLSDTLGDCIYEPQIESGIFDTTPGPNLLDFERMISEVGLEINEEFISIYAKKEDVTAEINLRADAINSVVGSLSNDVNELQGNYSSIEQTVDSITSTVAGHTSQLSTFQQTVNQIYLAIEDAGSGEFSSIIQRLDDIELKVGAPGQEGSIHVAINAINLMVSDIDEGLSSIELTVNDISSTVSTHTGQMSVVQQSVNSISSTVSTHTGQLSAFQQTVDEISSTVSAHTGQISTFQQTVDEIYLAVEDAVSGEYSSIIQRLNSIEVKVGNGEGTGSIQATSTEINLRVDAIDIGLTDVTITASGLLSSVSDLEDNFSTINQKVGSIDLTVADNEDKVAALRVDVDSISSTVYDENTGMSAIVQKVDSISSTVYDEHGTLLSQISQDGSNVKITASQIDLRGYFTAGNYFSVSTDGKLEATDAILSALEIRGGFITQGWGVVPEMRVNIQSDFPSSQPGYTAGDIVAHGGYKLNINRNPYETKYKITLDNHRDDNYKVGQYNNINTIEVSPERINIRREYNEASTDGALRKISAEINVDEFSNQLVIRLVGLPSSPVSGCVYRDSNGYLRIGL